MKTQKIFVLISLIVMLSCDMNSNKKDQLASKRSPNVLFIAIDDLND